MGEPSAVARTWSVPVNAVTEQLSRRRFLRGLAAAGAGAALAACAPAPSASPDVTSLGTSSATLAPVPSPPPSNPPPGPSIMPSTSPDLGALRRTIAGLLVVGFRGLTIGPADPIAGALADGLGGVVLFDRDQLTGTRRNIASPMQLATLTASLRGRTSRPLLIALDQEGGTVARLNPSTGYPAFAGEAAIGASGAAIAATWARAMAGALRAAGVTLNLAPVVDLDSNPSNPAIGALGRSFSADPAVVTALARIEIEAHRAAGVLTTLKHFPGLGSATGNTDFGVVDVTATWSPLELRPYADLVAAGLVDLVMSGNLVNGRIEEGRPASLSRATITGRLRGEIGWQGVVITDDLQAKAITDRFGADEAVALAIEAGNDLLLFANQQVYVGDVTRRVVDAIVGYVASGRISETRINESAARVDALRRRVAA